MSKTPNSDRYLVLLEDMNSKIEMIAEGQLQMKTELRAEICTRYEDLDDKIQILQIAIQSHAREFRGIHTKLDQISEILARHDSDIRDIRRA